MPTKRIEPQPAEYPEPVSSAPNKGGRPPKLKADATTLSTLEGLGKIQCTTKEAAAVLKVSEPTFLKFLGDNPEAREVFEAGKAEGRSSLRRTQFRLAETNAAMAIFLGKNYLGQTDKQEHQHTGAGGGPIQTVDLSKVSDDDLRRLEQVLGTVADPGRSGGAEGPDPGGTGAEEG
jgi:hypothetical protein